MRPENSTRPPELARRSRTSSGLLAAGSVVAVGAYPDSDPSSSGRPTRRNSWAVESPLPVWLPTTLAALLVLQWSVMAVIAMNG